MVLHWPCRRHGSTLSCSSLLLSQDAYQETHPVLFGDRAVYVIVYSLRTEVNSADLHRHLMKVTFRFKDAPIILVGTHLDAVGASPYLPLREFKAKYPQVGASGPVAWPQAGERLRLWSGLSRMSMTLLLTGC